MPFYRYECEACGSVFKVLEQNGNASLPVCPECEGRRARRLLPRIGVIYKGSGYYATDYRAKNGKASAAKVESQAAPGGNGERAGARGESRDRRASET
jgi:putative FmdB family regulatory protein